MLMTINLLILDDHEEVRDLLASRLREQADIDVVGVTSDVREAERECARLQPDIVLIDIRRLPDAPAACRRLGQASPRSRLVVLTSYFREGEEEALREAGVDACLVKGVGLDEPLAEMRRLAAAREPALDGSAL